MVMSDRADRAKQFIPFDALKGFREALLEKERILADRTVLSEDMADHIDRMLRQISVGMTVSVVYFHNGEYQKKTGLVSRLDETGRMLTITKTQIAFDDIYDLCIETASL